MFVGTDFVLGLSVRDAGVSPACPITLLSVRIEMLKVMDGRIPITAVRDRGVSRAVGIDIDPQRIREANANAEEAGVTIIRFGSSFNRPKGDRYKVL